MATKKYGKGVISKKKKYNQIMAQPGIKDQIVQWRADGYSKAGIAIELGISVRTLEHWQNDIEEFKELIDKGDVKLTDKLEKMVYKKALGECKVIKTKKTIKRVGGKKIETVEQHTEEVPPDSNLLKWSLINKRPQKWKDRSIEITGNISSNVVFVNDLSELSDDDLAKLEKENLYDDGLIMNDDDL
jgi:hypothetical protein